MEAENETLKRKNQEKILQKFERKAEREAKKEAQKVGACALRWRAACRHPFLYPSPNPPCKKGVPPQWRQRCLTANGVPVDVVLSANAKEMMEMTTWRSQQTRLLTSNYDRLPVRACSPASLAPPCNEQQHRHLQQSAHTTHPSHTYVQHFLYTKHVIVSPTAPRMPSSAHVTVSCPSVFHDTFKQHSSWLWRKALGNPRWFFFGGVYTSP